MLRVLAVSPHGICIACLLVLFSSGCVTSRHAAPIYLIRVSNGDTLAGIAAKYDTTWRRIATLNDLEDGAEIKPGDVLRVQPGPGGYTAGGNKNLSKQQVPGHSSWNRSRSKERRRGIWTPQIEAEGAGDNALFEEAARSHSQKTRQGKTSKRPSSGLLFGGDEEAHLMEDEPSDESTSEWLRWPILGEVSSLYGRRGSSWHSGIDIRGRRGTPVAAAAAGRIAYAGRQNGYGKIVIIDHNEHSTAYAHLDSISVDVGDTVDAGQEIGAVGSSGNASGPHLHFEIRRRGGRAIDPLPMLPREELISGL